MAGGRSNSSANSTTTNKNDDDDKKQSKKKWTASSSSTKAYSSIFSVSCGATVLMALYIFMAGMNLMKLMYPLYSIDLSQYPPESFVHNLWSGSSSSSSTPGSNQEQEEMHMRIYLSRKPAFNLDFFQSEFARQEDQQESDAVSSSAASTLPPLESTLLWDEDVTHSPSLSRSFLLTSLDCNDNDGKNDDNNNTNNSDCDSIPSHHFAVRWLDQADKQALERGEGGVLAAMAAAGQGIESTSILLTLYQSVSQQIHKALVFLSLRKGDSNNNNYSKDNDKIDKDIASILERKTIHLPEKSPLWQSMIHSNSTVYVHVLVLRSSPASPPAWPPTTRQEAVAAIRTAAKSNSLLQGKVDMLKYSPPHHCPKPGRLLYKDVVYLFNRYVKGTREMPPWVMEVSKPEAYKDYERALAMKAMGQPYPYWKPEVAVKFINDVESYPMDLAMASGMPVAQIARSRAHPTGYAFLPAVHADEIGLTIDKYIPLNDTVHSLPLRISFDRSDMEHKVRRTTATEGGLSPARWRLFTHLSQALEQQKEFGFEQSDIDDLRRMIADTNLTLLAITMLASALHLLFEFLTFKSEVSFWRQNKDLTGLSVRSLFMDMFGQTVILLFLIEKESSLLMTVPSAIGCLIALWKCQKAAGLKFVPARKDGGAVAWYNRLPRLLIGRELRATRLEMASSTAESHSNKDKNGFCTTKESTRTNNNKSASASNSTTAAKRDLTALTIESDRLATRSLGLVLLPLVVGYTLYSLVYEEHTGWISWLITSASSAVYALGFVMMTPQLFLNWKLKSVAHLPWRVLIYKSLNTFIDDLFSFIIRMPTMARISCFRDDVVFFIYLYQRWLYPVDTSRPVEGLGEENQESDDKNVAATTSQKKNQ